MYVNDVFLGGSLSNLSCLSEFEPCCKSSSSKNKKSRSSVSSRSREGGSLPPTKFENVMLYETGNSVSNFTSSWDQPSQVSCNIVIFVILVEMINYHPVESYSKFSY